MDEFKKQYPDNLYLNNGLALLNRYWRSLGIVFLRKNSIPEAQKAFLNAVKYNSGDGDAYFHLGDILFKKAQNEEHLDSAILLYKKSIEFKGDFPHAFEMLAYSYYYKNDYETALKHAEKAKELGLVNSELLKMIRDKLIQ